MNAKFSMVALIGGMVMLSLMSPAQAGRTCDSHQVSVRELSSALEMADRLRRHLDRLDANHALVARVGGDISEHGLTYTHLGIAERQATNGSWHIIHQLNPCGSGRSVLRRHGLADFMLDDLHRHDVRLTPLRPNFARALETYLESDRAVQLHEPRYNMISHPGAGSKYQNSNQWVLEVLTDAGSPTVPQRSATRFTVQRQYRELGFQGSWVKIPALRRLGARLATSHIRFDDHPASQRAIGRFEVVTVRSILAHLNKLGLSETSIDLAGSYDRRGPTRQERKEKDAAHR